MISSKSCFSLPVSTSCLKEFVFSSISSFGRDLFCFLWTWFILLLAHVIFYHGITINQQLSFFWKGSGTSLGSVWYLTRHPWVSAPHPRSLPAAEAEMWPLWAFQLQLKMASKQFSKLCFGSKSGCARSLGEIIRFQRQPCAAPKPMELTGPSWSRAFSSPLTRHSWQMATNLPRS